MFSFEELSKVNLERCQRWHKEGLNNWSTSDWAVAMAGESGEVFNTIKKLNRIRSEILNKNSHDQIDSEQEAIHRIGEELADMLLYADLLAQSLGLSLENEIVKKFNSVSERYGFPERLN
jgi:NTP pyrophosphatase (non-canonical NTP hydrolase)